MELGVCQKGTIRFRVRFLICFLAAGLPVLAQTSPEWRTIGGPSVDLRLAAPATGPMARVWFSADGGLLYARTVSGNLFQTADFETWSAAGTVAEPPPV